MAAVRLTPHVPAPFWEDGVAHDGAVRVVVVNRGSSPAAYRIDLAWAGAGGAVPLNGAEASSFDIAERPLGPGASRAHDIPWTLQPGQVGSGEVEARAALVRADGSADGAADRTPADNVNRTSVFVPSRSFFLEADQTPAHIEAGGSGFVRVRLRNEGNERETVALSLLPGSGDPRLTARLSAARLEVPARSNMTAAVLVDFEPAGDFSPFTQTYRVQADPGFGAPRVVTTAPATLDAPGGVHDGSVTRLGAGEARVPQAGVASIPFLVRNTGDRSAVFALAPRAPDQWEASVVPADVDLHPGEAAHITLRVAPVAASEGSAWEVGVVATGRLVDGARVANVPVRIGGPSPVLTGVWPAQTPYAGEPVTILAAVRNLGDALPRPSAMTLLARAPGQGEAHLHADVPALGAGASDTIAFQLPAPIQGGHLELTVSWTPPGMPDLSATGRVLVHDVVLRVAAPPPTVGSPGETVAYRNGTHAFRVTNAGNAPERIDLAVAAAAGRAELDGDASIHLEPGASWLVAVRQTLPLPAGNVASVPLTLSARAGPVSESNATSTAVADDQPPLLAPARLEPRWNVGPAHPLPLLLVATDDAGIAAASATVTGPGGSAVVELVLGADGRYHGAADLFHRGNHTVRYAATDFAGNRAASPAQRVEATSLAPPALSLQDGDGGGRSVVVRIASVLPLRDVVAQVQQGNRTETVALPVAGGVARLGLDGLAPGEARILFTATDVSGASGVLETNVEVPLPPPTAGPAGGGRDAPATGLLHVAFAAGAAAWHRRAAGVRRGRPMTTTAMPTGSIEARLAVGSRVVAGRWALGGGAVLVAAALLGADLLGSVPPAAGPLGAPSMDGPDRAQDPQALLAQHLPGLAAPTLADWAAASTAGLPALPVPEAPPGPDPLGDALRAYARQRGLDEADTAIATADLGLAPEALSALSRLVLAFVQASALQQEALAPLSAEDLALFSGAPGAADPWLAANPGATLDDLEAHLLDLASRADGARMAQAADLLLRTIDAVRGPLAAVPPAAPAPLGPLPATPPSAAWELVRSVAGLPAAPAPQPRSLDEALAGLAQAYGVPHGTLPSMQGLLPASLEAAVASLVAAQALGTGVGPEQRAAAILSAAESAAPTLQAWGALLAMPRRVAQPADLDALVGAIARPHAPPLGIATAAGAIPEATLPPARPLAALLQERGLTPVQAAQAVASLPPQAGAALALLLQADDALAAAHADLAAALGPDAWAPSAAPTVAALLAAPAWTRREAEAMRDWAEAMGNAPPALLDALAHAQGQAAAAAAAAAAILEPMTVPMAGPPGVPLPGLPAPSVPAPCQATLFSDCGNDVLLDLDVAGGILVAGAGSSLVDDRYGDPRIVLDLGGDDVHTVSAGASANGFGVPGNLGGRLVGSVAIPPSGARFLGYGYVYGPWHQDLDTSLDNAQQGRFYAVLIDAAGDDVYASPAPAGQGAGIGLGTVGILWDRAGDDTYRQETGDLEDRHFQGAGGIGGLGLLVDESGSDLYEAPHGRSQGVGIAPALQARVAICATEDGSTTAGSLCTGTNRFDREDLGGSGILADLGDGKDRFTAVGGQGHSDGYGSVGVLYDEAGATVYTVLPASLQHQGGRGPAAAPGAMTSPVLDPPRRGGLAALLDLGGAGDQYNAPPFPDHGIEAAATSEGWLVVPGTASRKGDDVLWLETRGGAALGIDSTLLDEDGDGHSNLLELASGSDPRDAGDTPSGRLGGTLQDAVAQVTRIVSESGNQTRDSDGDAFPDGVETAAGTDPHDAGSAPGLLSDPGFLVTLAVLCPDDSAEDSPPPCAAPCEGGRCVSLLSIGGPGATRHNRTALLEIDLGGDDTYATTVAGPGAIATPRGPQAPGSVSIDVAGNDTYDTPDIDATQAFARPRGASLLLDLAGNDTYAARDSAQGSASDGVAVLADFAGDDRYGARRRAQGDLDGSQAGPFAAALVDLAGDDTYTAATQARLRGGLATGRQGLAVLLDAQGTDAYTLTETGATPYDRQGVSALVAPAGTADTSRAATSARALFLDLGDALDLHWDASVQPPAEHTAEKNGRVLHANPAAAGAGTFSDGLAQDDDGDGFPSLAEALAGSDPKDAASVPASEDGVRVRPAPGAGIRLPGLTISGSLDDVHAHRSDFLVDLGGDDRYLSRHAGGAMPALHAPSGVPFATTVLLDVAGDDEYRPDPCVTDATFLTDILRTTDPTESNTPTSESGALATQGPVNPRVLLHCPALGGAVLGVAVLADQGGDNVFDAASRIHITADARTPSGGPGDADVQVRAWGVSLGASLFNGAGVLATFGGSSHRLASVDVLVRETNTLQQDPSADAFGVVQGAAYGAGLGASLSFGGGDDVYHADVIASAPRAAGQDGGRARAYGQGAALGGLGTLVDDGGSNQYLAPAGFAQGFASVVHRPFAATGPQPQSPLRPVGALWSGPGDDAFLGGTASQGSAGIEQILLPPIFSSNNLPDDTERRQPATGLLVDVDGAETYRVSPAPPPARPRENACPAPIAPVAACALSQGAADLGGVAFLADLSGDDRYVAPGRSHVQGSGRDGGYAMLFDGAGNDRYEARSDGQGYARSDPLASPGAGGLLVDLMGRDSYMLEARGQGYSDSAVPEAPVTTFVPVAIPFDEAALLLDLGGQDRYVYGMPKAPAAGGSRPADDNRWQWTQRPAGPTGGVSRGLGIDADGLDEAVAAYQAAAPDALETSVDLCLRRPGGDCLAAGVPASGVVEAVVSVKPGAGLAAQRVTLLRDGTPTSASDEASGGTFVFPWDTRLAAADGVRDGTYTLTAVAWMTPAPDGSSPAGTAGGLPVSSPDLAVVVDNAPVGRARLDRHAVSPNVTSTAATLSIDVGADVPAQGAPHTPGALVRVDLAGPRSWTLHATSAANGTLTIPVTGACGPLPCPDGEYSLTVSLQDARGQTTHLPALGLVIDGTPPASSLVSPQAAGAQPVFANHRLQVGGDGLAISWQAWDDLSPVLEVEVVRLSDDGDVLESRPEWSPTQTTTFQPIASGTRHRFLTLATDALGNKESLPAKLSQQPDQVAVVDVDFLPPTVSHLAADPPIVRPGVPVRLSAAVSDSEDALAGVFLTAGGARDVPSTPLELQEDGRYGLVVNFTQSADPQGEETPYVFTVVASDAAGNTHPGASLAALLDSRAPRLTLLQTTYRKGPDDVPLGSPGAIAQVVLLAEDHKTVATSINATAFGLGTLACSDEASGRRWRCPVPIPGGTKDGRHDLAVTAEDAAGNVRSLPIELVVDSLPPAILDVNVTAVGPDFIELTWNTSAPTRGAVAYGRTAALGSQTEFGEDRSEHHVVRIDGLTAASLYHLRPLAISEANTLNDSAAAVQATTASAFMVDLLPLPTLGDWSGLREVPVEVKVLLDEHQKVSLLLKVQDAARAASPLPVDSLVAGTGQHNLTVDTVLLPDGLYVAVVEGVRQGDTVRKESAPFRVDNTPPVVVPLSPAPGRIAPTARPQLEFAVIDPLRADLPPASSAVLVLDGAVVDDAVASYGPRLGAQGRLRVALPETLMLADGPHEAVLRLTDSAGNDGIAEWPFTVDASAPDAVVRSLRYAPGADHARPGGPATAWIELHDLSGAASATLDLRPWGGLAVPLAAHANGTWMAAFTLPPGLPDGRIDVPLNATDANGHTGPAGSIAIDVDGTPPTIHAAAVRAVDRTTVAVTARTEEPVMLEVVVGPRAVRGVLAQAHEVVVPGLVPGQGYEVRLRANDTAGNPAEARLAIRLPEDGQAPGAPRSASATPGEDGVLVSWGPAPDNTGVARYVVTRVQAGRQVAMDAGSALRLVDAGALPGPVTYRVHAVDVAGLAGVAAEARTYVHAPADLGTPAITPAQGASGKPFHVSVTYRHPGGIEPDAVTLHHAGREYPLARVPGTASCLDGCEYAADVLLPARDALRPAGATYVEAIVAGVPTRLALDPPLVLASGEGFHAGRAEGAPAASLLLALAALAVALLARRGGHR